jgi:hypothetical protein
MDCSIIPKIGKSIRVLIQYDVEVDENTNFVNEQIVMIVLLVEHQNLLKYHIKILSNKEKQDIILIF